MHLLVDLLKRAAPEFGPSLAADTHRRGLAVTHADGSTRAIPVTATPIVLPQEEIERRATAASLLSSAAFKMAQSTLRSNDAERLLGALSPLERRVAEATQGHLLGLATTRVDYFVADQTPWALEVNATIPAMQGYSDIAATAFIEHVGRRAGIDDRAIARIQAMNGSNALALYRALIEGYAQQRPGRVPERILLLCRRHDSQISEQQHLAQQFQLFGTEAEVIHPDELSGDKEVRARGRKWDLVYRHLFVRRLEETPCPWVEAYFEHYWAYDAVLLNPPSAQVEVKTAFALLSRALTEPLLAERAELTEAELEVIRSLVPWTRQLRAESAVGPDGARVDNLLEEVAAAPHRFVLKRSWDYGGKAVFVGRGVGTAQYEERVRAAYGQPLPWSEVCARAAADPSGGGFIVQQFVDNVPEPHLLCTAEGVHAADLYVDFSAYGSVQPGRAPRWGGVCRGSVSQIVNIVGGGGVLPLLTHAVADELLTAFQARLPRR